MTEPGPRVTASKRRLHAAAGPIFQQISTNLRAQIESGELAPGDPVPSESQLVERYGVSRNTVRRSMQALRASGLVETKHGQATRVSRSYGFSPSQRLEFPPVVHRESGGFATWDSQGWTDVKEPSCYRGEAGRHAHGLDLDPSMSLYVQERQLAHASGAEILHRLYLPLVTVDLLDRGDAPFLTPAELYQALTDAGHVLSWDDTINAAIPAPDEAATLDIPDGIPIFIHTRTTRGTDGAPLGVEETHLPADRITIAVRGVHGH